MDDFQTYLRAYPAEEIKRFMVLLSRADYRAKSSSQSGSILANPLAELFAEIIR
ncbi:MAG: hypothetical protein ACRCUT_12625 [Spirochaetota bacterium]